MAEQPATTMPEINTEYIRSIVAGSDVCDTRFLTEALAAVDTLRKHFAAQQHYINALERANNEFAERTKGNQKRLDVIRALIEPSMEQEDCDHEGKLAERIDVALTADWKTL